MFGDPHGSNLRSAFIGAVVAAVVMLSFPAVAAVGDALKLGQANTANAVTSLSGSAAASLRITNSQSGSPALDLRVQPGAAPFKVDSKSRVRLLNADRLDGRHSVQLRSLSASCGSEDIPDGVNWACNQTIVVPRPGVLLMSGSVDLRNGAPSGTSYRFWCSFNISGDAYLTLPASDRDLNVDGGEWGTCASDVSQAVQPGTYQVHFNLLGLAASTEVGQGASWVIFVPS